MVSMGTQIYGPSGENKMGLSRDSNMWFNTSGDI